MAASTKIREWLEEQNMTVTELARQLGYARPHVSDMLNGAEPISDGFIGRFAKCFGFDQAQAVFDGDCQEQAA
jgi:plasmid maintenance system antidote protein VapI